VWNAVGGADAAGGVLEQGDLGGCGLRGDDVGDGGEPEAMIEQSRCG
jgi:hypothetical protein